MYNKISSIILNSGKANGLSDVFVAQPDSLKENLAGKIFIIAEIGGKKTEGRKIFDFLIDSLNETYYNDEKILLRDKIEGLKIENIFEAAISKTNKNLSDFLLEEKIKLNPAATNLTVGVIFENKLYFSGFGKNRALLIYRHGEQFEIINVEANASDINSPSESGDRASIKTPSLFSSVISGEIPTGSFFVFASEALLEYVSSKDLINIITKLPPIVASEQIKNILARINSFIPFLGIIIKNTIGIDNQEVREEVEENLTAHSSISSLNYTEQKTERMLAPAGLISISKIYKGAIQIVKNLRPVPRLIPKKVYRPDETENVSASMIDLGKVKSLSIARSDSFLIKEKIFFKKKPNLFGQGFKNVILGVPSFFSPRLWSGLGTNLKNWLGSLTGKNRLLFIVLFAVIVIFFASLGISTWTKKIQAAKNNYNNLVATIGEKQNAIDSFLIYGNEDSAEATLIDARALLSYLPREKKDQIAAYTDLENKLNIQADKIQKVVRVDSTEKVNDLTGLQITNIVWADGKIYAAGGKMLFGITPQSSSSTRFEISGATALSNPQFDRKSIIYYWDNNKIAQFNLKTNQSSLVNVTGEFNADGITSYKIFGSSLYVIAKNKNQIYRFALGSGGYNTKTDWLKVTVDLSAASDLYIDGSIYVLKNDGQVSKFYLNKASDYSASAISPVMSSASKIIVGTKYVYIFEASSKRLAVLAIKDGHLMNQYQLNSLSQLKDFAVDENNKLAYFLDGEAVYRITLNQ
ncbi:MAG: hypothetical protein WCN88_01420 [Candidatus Falkowbacteria bacterium]